jgi:hypothetical protein
MCLDGISRTKNGIKQFFRIILLGKRDPVIYLSKLPINLEEPFFLEDEEYVRLAKEVYFSLTEEEQRYFLRFY